MNSCAGGHFGRMSIKLTAISMVKNEEYWIWYSLTSVSAVVDEILVFDNHSTDRTVDVIRGMDHISERLQLFEGFGGPSEQDNREAMLAEARTRGATHVLFLDGDEIHRESNLAFCRKLLELHDHQPALQDPPRNHGRARDHEPTDGILIKNIGFRPIHPGFAGVDTCRPQDLRQPDTDHGCYNYAVRICSLAGLKGNGKEWGQHGFLETGDQYIQSSAHTLWLPKMYYYHFSWHPRSSQREGGAQYGHGVKDFGAVALPLHVSPPEVLFRGDGPPNPSLVSWGLRDSADVDSMTGAEPVADPVL